LGVNRGCDATQEAKDPHCPQMELGFAHSHHCLTAESIEPICAIMSPVSVGSPHCC